MGGHAAGLGPRMATDRPRTLCSHRMPNKRTDCRQNRCAPRHRSRCLSKLLAAITIALADSSGEVRDRPTATYSPPPPPLLPNSIALAAALASLLAFDTACFALPIGHYSTCLLVALQDVCHLFNSLNSLLEGASCSCHNMEFTWLARIT